MSNLVNPMTRDNLDTNIIAHDRNLIIMDFINSIKDLYQFNV